MLKIKKVKDPLVLRKAKRVRAFMRRLDLELYELELYVGLEAAVFMLGRIQARKIRPAYPFLFPYLQEVYLAGEPDRDTQECASACIDRFSECNYDRERFARAFLANRADGGSGF